MSPSQTQTIKRPHVESAVPTEDIRIAVLDGEAEREALFRFRHDVYVREMRRPQAHADHTHGRIEDPLDATGINLVAWQGERIVGCVRANLARDGRLEFHDALYDMAAHSPDYPHGVGIVTRLMLARELRGSEFTTRLFLRLYRLSLQQGVQHAYMDCNAHLQPLFLRFGFVAHIPVREHPEYGLVQPMRLDLHDHAHLARVASPYLPELQAFRETTQVSAGHPAKLGQ